jgi:hypothetical protein
MSTTEKSDFLSFSRREKVRMKESKIMRAFPEGRE